MNGYCQGAPFPWPDLYDDSYAAAKAGGSVSRQLAPFEVELLVDECGIAEDKRKLKQMAAWRRYAKRRAEREVQLFQPDEDGAGPVPRSVRDPQAPIMTGLPTVTVALDSGSNTFPTDITSRTEGDVTISCYGRTDEEPVAQSATLNLTLDTDGALSVSGLGFGLGGFGLGGFGGAGGGVLAPGPRIRCTFTVGATTRNGFTAASCPPHWGGPGVLSCEPGRPSKGARRLSMGCTKSRSGSVTLVVGAF
jgi:hypothetical protein